MVLFVKENAGDWDKDRAAFAMKTREALLQDIIDDQHKSPLRAASLIAQAGYALVPVGEGNDTNRMVQIDTVIADFRKVSDQFGNTCVYIRRGGMAWGAVALNRRADDEKHGVFDLQASHDRDKKRWAEQVRRLKAMLKAAETPPRTGHEDATEEIRLCLVRLTRMMESYDNGGDWYGCIRNAIPYLEESLKSSPPGDAT